MPKSSHKKLTAPDRLNLLMPWLNGELDTEVGSRLRPQDAQTVTDFEAVRRAIDTFVTSFDGSAGAGHLEVVANRTPPPPHIAAATTSVPPTDEELGELETRVRLLLEQGFGDPTLEDLSFPVTSLRLAIRKAGRARPQREDTANGTSIVMGGRKALRDYAAPGAYVVQVQGATVELAPFLVAHLLTQQGMVAVRKCPAPRCDKFIITATAARGRPRIFCSASCRVRHAEVLQQQRTSRKGKK